MKMKSKVLAVLAIIGLGVALVAAGSTVRVSGSAIGRTVINAPPEKVIEWLSTDGKSFSVNKETGTATYVWWPGYEAKLLDTLATGNSFSYTAHYGGVEFSGEGVSLGPNPIQPGVPSINKYSGGHDATWTSLVVPVEEGTKLIFVCEYSLDAPAAKADKIRKDVDDHMANAVKIIKEAVEKESK